MIKQKELVLLWNKMGAKNFLPHFAAIKLVRGRLQAFLSP